MYLALAIVGGFALSLLLTLAATLWSIVRGTFTRDYLTVLNTAGTIWGGITGAVIGFYFGGAPED